MHQYLASSEYIDWKAPEVLVKARSLAEGVESLERIADKCFVFVRDEIKHSWDYGCDPVTCKASDVLRHGTGYCCEESLTCGAASCERNSGRLVLPTADYQ